MNIWIIYPSQLCTVPKQTSINHRVQTRGQIQRPNIQYSIVITLSDF